MEQLTLYLHAIMSSSQVNKQLVQKAQQFEPGNKQDDTLKAKYNQFLQ